MDFLDKSITIELIGFNKLASDLIVGLIPAQNVHIIKNASAKQNGQCLIILGYLVEWIQSVLGLQ